MSPNGITRAPASIPLAIGPANCEHVLGVSWRWLRDHSGALGLTIWRVDSKPFIDAAAALEAVKRHGELVSGTAPANDDEAEAEPTIADLRARLGMRRAVGGGR